MMKTNFLKFGALKMCSLIILIGLTFTACKDKETPPIDITDQFAATIDPSTTFQVIRGFGGATVFQNPAGVPSAADMDKLFGISDGQIGLSILRIRLASDDDPAWRATELTNAKRAKAHGALVIASPWSPPIRMKSNGSLIGGTLIVDSLENYARYLNKFADYMANNGAELYALSVQNEPDMPGLSYESCDWYQDYMRDFLKNYGNLITSTKVIAPESFKFDQDYTNVIINDAGALANIDIIGGHLYGGGLKDYANARNTGKEIWMTEHYTSTDSANIWNGAIAVGKEIHDCMTIGQYSAYVWWYLKRFYGPLGEDGIVTKRGWVMSNFAKFVRPGFYRVSVDGTIPSGIYISAYYGDKLVIVAINTGPSVIEQKFNINNLTATSFTPYTTSSTLNLSAGTSIPVAENSFSFNLPAQSITTFVEDL
jgi:glucuronoarabinoxylan endo-1,4-beta-xylanase